jgi:hypothetical protein
MSALRKSLYAVGAFIAVAAIGIGGTIFRFEKTCVADKPAPAVTSSFGIADPFYQRAQGDSFLTFPEWYIVHAYNDLTAVTAQSSESGFHYLASIGGFWSSLCSATQRASLSGPATADQKATNYIIGFSFTAEMASMGLYERTMGALTEWIAGGRKTPEDEFNLALLKEYSAFLYQTPWYQFPFGEKFVAFWRETPFTPSIRAIERRGSLSTQYVGRWAYAALMRFIAGYDPADLTIRSVVGGSTPTDLAAMKGVKVIREVDNRGEHGVLVETARYAEFDAFVRELGRHPPASLLEVAGNQRILVTVIAPDGSDTALAAAGGDIIFRLPIQSSPGSRRVGIDMPIRSLVNGVAGFEAAGLKFEHAYDY